jgi:predicted N-acyltransferase
MATFELSTHASIRDLGADTWAALAESNPPPFLSYDFLDVLEATGCVGGRTGWHPLHLVVRQGGEPVAAAAAYMKENSDGEFVFDHSWAQFAHHQLGTPYYPKLVVAAPFTPATGEKLRVRPGQPKEPVRRAFVAGLAQICERGGLSGAHVLFPAQAEAEALTRVGMDHRFGVQYHWRNAGYETFDDYLARYPSRRRKRIKRECRSLEEQGTAIEVLTGAELTPPIVDLAYQFYVATVNKYYWGRQYLNRAFFEELCARMGDRVLFVLARDAGSRLPIAGAFNLLGDDALYGRYWGAREERPFLHFNVCYYQGIRECIARGLSVFEPGAGGEHKLARGFEPTVTHSTHLLRDQRLASAVHDYLGRERAAIEQHVEQYESDPVFKAPADIGEGRGP